MTAAPPDSPAAPPASAAPGGPRVLFAFENPLPSRQADAEVFVSTARHLAPLLRRSWLHVPLPATDRARAAAEALAGMPVVRARAPLRPAALRHLCCGLGLPFRRAFREADLVYTRNLWIAFVAILCGQRVAFDHYRPWAAQVPPLQPLIARLLAHPRFLVNVCHSDYTRERYLALGLAPARLVRVRNGFDPDRFRARPSVEAAKRALGLDPARRTVVYTGRLNHRKGLALVVEAARLRPDHLFLLVGSTGEGPVEALAAVVPNVRVVPWKEPDALAAWILAADVLLVPPSWKPLAEFGSTVLPLKLFLYLAAGRAIVAGDTPDVREVLRHGDNAVLCRPDDAAALAGALDALARDPALAGRLAARALADSRDLTWTARARTIAALLAARLAAPDAPPPPAPGWGRAQSLAWRRGSALWLRHLLRTRSWVLPPALPDAPPPDAPPPDAPAPRAAVPAPAP